MSKKLIADLERQIALRDAMTLTRYAIVPYLDRPAVLAASTERTVMRQPLGRGWAVTAAGVVEATFTTHRDFVPSHVVNMKPWPVLSWHADEQTAWGAFRNNAALRYAEKLLDLDNRIYALAAAKSTPLVAPGMSCDVGETASTAEMIGDTGDNAAMAEGEGGATHAESATVAQPSDDFMPEQPDYAAAKAAAQEPDPREVPEKTYKPGRSRKGRSA